MTATIADTVSTPVESASPAARLYDAFNLRGVVAAIAGAAVLFGCAQPAPVFPLTQAPQPPLAPPASVQVAMVGSTNGLLAPDSAIQDDRKGCPRTAGAIPYTDGSLRTYLGPSPHAGDAPGFCLVSVDKTRNGVRGIRTDETIFGLFAGDLKGHFLDTDNAEVFARGMWPVLLRKVEESEFSYYNNKNNLVCIKFSDIGGTSVNTVTAEMFRMIAYFGSCAGTPENAGLIIYKRRPDGFALMANGGDTWYSQAHPSNKKDFSVSPDVDSTSLLKALASPSTGRPSALQVR